MKSPYTKLDWEEHGKNEVCDKGCHVAKAADLELHASPRRWFVLTHRTTVLAGNSRGDLIDSQKEAEERTLGYADRIAQAFGRSTVR